MFVQRRTSARRANDATTTVLLRRYALRVGALSTGLDFFDTVTGVHQPEAVLAESWVLATSRDLHWDGIVAECGRSRSFEPDDLAMSGHYVAINLAREPLIMETKGATGFQTRTLSPGSFWIMPADMPFTQRNRRSHWGGVEISRQRTRRVLGCDLDIKPGYGVIDESLARVMRAMLHEISIGGASGALYADGLAIAIIARLAERHATRAPRSCVGALGTERLRSVREWVECTLGQQITVGELAAHVGLSPAHFTREFKRATGTSPHTFVMERRLERAWRLLVAGKSIADAAVQSGFCDQAHLSRLFKIRFGVTPGVFRRRC
jgi:AraC family transcriptional regulator